MIGSDGSSNPICFDVSQNDRIILFDHDRNFNIIAVVDTNIEELSACLLLYKNFISKIQKVNEQQDDSEPNFLVAELSELKGEFRKINDNIFKESEFWQSEIDSLTEEIGRQ